MNLGRYVSRSATYWPTSTALIFGNRRFTYCEFDERTNRLACALLALGLRMGDRIAIQSWNRHEVVEFEIACYKAGLVRVPINARLSIQEALHILNDSEAKAVIFGPLHVEALLDHQKEIPSVSSIIGIGNPQAGAVDYETLLNQSANRSPDIEVDYDDIAVLHYTSGTTGKLKAAIQTFGNRLAFLRKATMTIDTRVEQGDTFALVGPVTHATGMNIMPVLFSGGCNLVMERFDADVLLRAVAPHRITHLFLVPTMVHMLLDHPKCRDFDLGSLKRLIYGSAPISPKRVEEAMELFGPILVQGYGAGETTSLVTVLTMRDHVEASCGNSILFSSCGRAVFDTEVRVMNEEGREVTLGEIGEVVVQGPDVMKGYWKEPGLTQEVLKDGWYHTGDLAHLGDRGYLYIVDRKKDMIISGGFNIYPSEVENALYTHPAVCEACVVGIPDEKWGEAVKGVVTLKPGKVTSEAELIEHCLNALGRFKKPQSIDFVNELPKNPNGKIMRRLVKENYWQGRSRRVH